MRIYDGKEYRDMTEEELSQFETNSRLAEIAERNRPMTQEEVSRVMIVQSINTLVVDDNTALRMKDFYPQWAKGVFYEVGFKVQYGNKLYKVYQNHTSQEGWEPTVAVSLWIEINETHDGSIDDPVPYNGNMVLESGKYYIQDNVIYLCTRDTINPVYQPMRELVGLYVEVY